MNRQPTSFFVIFLLLIIMASVISCSEKKTGFHFSSLESSQTNIDFNNKLIENDSVNFMSNQYIYIGSGVGIGDFNNDGLPDIFFAGGQVSCKLYLNKGDFKFDDITEKAGVETKVWCTGVTVVDINNDGLQDIYVCVSHSKSASNRKNLLFINKGNLEFSEQAAEYGLADSSFSTQAAFMDYDKDGDLDMYLMNHNIFQNQPNNIAVQNVQGTATSADKLYRNEGISPGKNHPVYKDVSQETGIRDDGYGLGIVVSDFNNDNWPDIYIANDFIGNDILWLNNKNGTFTNSISTAIRHQSYNSMGVDAADLNNDQLPDLGVLDMLPEINKRKKTMFAGSNPERYDMEQRQGGYQPEFTRNVLQLNNGNRKINDHKEPFFSEIGQLAGVSETDWSWSILMADFDDDGMKDMYITNGIAKDLTNNDFLFFSNTQNGQNSFTMGSGNEAALKSINIGALRKELDSYGSIKINNYFFHNDGNISFT
ncbi:MAG: VCBS repeat-containing protein, partial [Ferruginibacter sp.]